jgi:hypothetical protein
MILFPAMMVGGQLLIAVVDQVPDLNFQPICRDATVAGLGFKDDSKVCIEDEKAARAALAKRWAEFASVDRARCIRMSTMNQTASYVEVLTCLEMELEVRRLHRGANPTPNLGAPDDAAPEREDVRPPAPAVRVVRHPEAAPPPAPPLALEPRRAPESGFPQILCLPGLKTILPGCVSSGGRP